MGVPLKVHWLPVAAVEVSCTTPVGSVSCVTVGAAGVALTVTVTAPVASQGAPPVPLNATV